MKKRNVNSQELYRCLVYPFHFSRTAQLQRLVQKAYRRTQNADPALPGASLKTLVEDSYKGIKPFKANGEGYKDYLIWHSILADLRKTPKEIKTYVLTNNVNDFCEKRRCSRPTP